jgi:hypothetical protein
VLPSCYTNTNLPLTIRSRSPCHLTAPVNTIRRLFFLLGVFLVTRNRTISTVTPQRARILAIVHVLAIHAVDVEWLCDARPRCVHDHLSVVTGFLVRARVLFWFASWWYATVCFVEEPFVLVVWACYPRASLANQCSLKYDREGFTGLCRLRCRRCRVRGWFRRCWYRGR